MPRGRDDDGSSNGVGVHARLRVVVQSHQSPVGNNTSHALLSFKVSVDDQVFYRRCIKQDDIGHGKHFRQERGSEQRRMFDYDKCSLVLIRNTKLLKERIRRFSDDLGKAKLIIGASVDQGFQYHRRHELSTKPSSTSGSYVGLDNRNFKLV